MGGDIELGLATDRLDRPLKRAIGEGGKQAALLADQMVVVPLGVDPLIASRVAADLNPVHEVKPLELVESAIDARPPDRVEPPIDLKRSHRAGLDSKQIDHLSPRRAAAISGLVEALHRCLSPIHGRDRIRE